MADWPDASVFAMLQNAGAAKPKTRAQAPRKRSGAEGEMWAEKYSPGVAAELVVHKKKVEEVRGALLQSLSAKRASIILLTGPVGAGKSATVKMLASELGFDVTEWHQPTRQQEYDFDVNGAPQYSQSAISQFRDFVIRSQRYKPLAFGGSGERSGSANKRRITLVEDVPNAAVYDPAAFHAVLEAAVATSTSPLVIIASNRSEDGRVLAKIFPKQVLDRLGVVEVKFNAVAPTAIAKALRRVAEAEQRDVSARAIEQIVEVSGGDLRCAVNSLQVLCLEGVEKVKPATGKRKRKRLSKKTDPNAEDAKIPLPDSVGTRYLPLDMFHALGRVLYAKRGLGNSDAETLPPELSHHGRLPSSVKGGAEDAMESSNLPPDMFTLFLHENYPPLFSKFEDIEAATEHFSDADLLMGGWSTRETLMPLAGSVCCRGLIHANTVRASGSWRPLRKPQSLYIDRDASDTAVVARRAFFEGHDPASFRLPIESIMSTQAVFTELLPWTARLRRHGLPVTGDQRLQLDSLCSFGQRRSGNRFGSSFTQNNADAALASVLDSSIDEASPSTPDLFGSGVVDVVVPAPNTKNSVDDIEEWDSD